MRHGAPNLRLDNGRFRRVLAVRQEIGEDRNPRKSYGAEIKKSAPPNLIVDSPTGRVSENFTPLRAQARRPIPNG